MPSDREIFFQGFSKEQKQTLLDLAEPEHYAIQAAVVQEGKEGSNTFIVEEGIVSVWVRDVKVNELGPESVLGVSALIEPHTRTASLIAEIEVRVLRLERSKMLEYLETVPSKLFHQFFVNAFRIHMKLVRRCEERIVQLSRELNAI